MLDAPSPRFGIQPGFRSRRRQLSENRAIVRNSEERHGTPRKLSSHRARIVPRHRPAYSAHMARRIVHQLVDDLDGTILEVGEGETVLFSLDGVAYEIDLTDDNAAALRAAVAPYVAAARSISSSAFRDGLERQCPRAPPARTAGLQRSPRVGEGQRIPGLGARAGAGIRSRRVRSRALKQRDLHRAAGVRRSS